MASVILHEANGAGEPAGKMLQRARSQTLPRARGAVHRRAELPRVAREHERPRLHARETRQGDERLRDRRLARLVEEDVREKIERREGGRRIGLPFSVPPRFETIGIGIGTATAAGDSMFES